MTIRQITEIKKILGLNMERVLRDGWR